MEDEFWVEKIQETKRTQVELRFEELWLEENKETVEVKEAERSEQTRSKECLLSDFLFKVGIQMLRTSFLADSMVTAIKSFWEHF